MTKEETDLIIAEQNKSTEEILKAVAKVKSDYHELCNLKDMRIKELEQQIEKMKCCSNCKHFNKEDDLECCQNCERLLVNSLDNLSREEIIKDEWEIKENE